MRNLLVAAGILILAAVAPAAAQAAEAPAFTLGDNTLYAHSSEDSLEVWMNSLVDDGFGPYQLTGESAFTDPVLGLGLDPVADEDFEARIMLTPGLGQALVLEGTVTVQAYIGGGTYTAGTASIATSLAIDGVVVASAEAKDHIMTGEAQPGPYDAISWTMTVPSTAVPAGATVEWVLSGNIEAGNNVFLASNEARGRSHIILPVVDLPGPAVSQPQEGNTTQGANSDGNTTADGNQTPPGPAPGQGNQTSTAGQQCPDAGACTATEATGNETDDDLDSVADGKESPGPAVPLVLALIAAVAAVRARRR